MNSYPKSVVLLGFIAGFCLLAHPVQASDLNPPGQPVAVGRAVLEFSRQVSTPHLALPGSYAIIDTITNSGTATAYNVVITQDLTTGFSFENEAKLLVKIGNIGVGETVTRNSTIVVTDQALPGRYSNDATASASGLDSVEASAIIDIVSPAVLGASTSLAETGVCVWSMILWLFAGCLVMSVGLVLLRPNKSR